MIIKSKLVHSLINIKGIKKLLCSNRLLSRIYFEYLYFRRDPYFIVDSALRDEKMSAVDKAFGLVEGLKVKNALEIGCGNGKLSHYVAAISENVLAIDISENAIKWARKINKCMPNVQYQRTDMITDDFGSKKFDFIFCSEVLYYLDRSQLPNVILKIISLLKPNGKVLLVHSRSVKDDSNSAGLTLKEFGAKTVHEIFINAPELEKEQDIIEERYRYTLLRRHLL